jgi:hypothetical protein
MSYKRQWKKNAAFAVLIAGFASTSVSLAAPPQHATEICIRILDSRTHRALGSRKVQIDLSGMDAQSYQIMVGRTGPDGMVAFEVKEPVPPVVDIGDLASYPCSQPESFPTHDIMDSGVVARWPPSGFRKADRWCTPNPGVAQPTPKPGEVVFFVHPLNVWENFWYTLLK